MSQWRNITKLPITFRPDGPQSLVRVEPGAEFVLDADYEFLVGTQINRAHVARVGTSEAAVDPEKAPSLPDTVPVTLEPSEAADVAPVVASVVPPAPAAVVSATPPAPVANNGKKPKA